MKINEITRYVLLRAAEDAVEFPTLDHSADVALAFNAINVAVNFLSLDFCDAKYDKKKAYSRDYSISEVITAFDVTYNIGSSMYIDAWLIEAEQRQADKNIN
ncbi:MAG: hypothetical protein IIW91_07770 [Alistipes sp.]|nr:hypothetical protein [Alistipes sp.]